MTPLHPAEMVLDMLYESVIGILSRREFFNFIYGRGTSFLFCDSASVEGLCVIWEAHSCVRAPKCDPGSLSLLLAIPY